MTPGSSETISPDRPDRPGFPALAFVLVLAAALKISNLSSYMDHSPFYKQFLMDDAVYTDWAMQINEEGYAGKGVFYRAPLYPYFLSFIFKFSGNSVLAAYGVQVILGLGTIAFIYLTARWLCSTASAISAALLAAFYAPILFFETKLLPTTLGLFLGIGSVYFLASAEYARSRARLFGGVLIMAFAILCLPQYMFVIPVLGILVVLRHSGEIRRWIAPAAVSASILAVVIGAVTLRNFVVSRDFIPISANAGLTFAQGNAIDSMGAMTGLPGITGSAIHQEAEERAAAERALGRKLQPSDVNAYWVSRGMDYIRSNPGDFAELVFRKLILAASSFEVPDNFLIEIDRELCPAMRLAGVPFGIILSLSGIGLAAVWTRRLPGIALTAAFLGSLLTLFIFYVSSRYRLILVPVACVLAGIGIEEIRRRFREGASWRPWIFAALAIAAASHPAWSPLKPQFTAWGNARLWYTAGEAYRREGNRERARWAYDRARTYDPFLRVPEAVD